MTELSGHVQDFGLIALVRFLAESGRNGCLKISQQSWTGEVVLDHGLLAASIGEERGAAALELIALALSDGTFVYTDRPPGAQPLGDTAGIQLQQALEWLAARPPFCTGTALLRSVPHVAEVREDARQREVALSRMEIAVLQDIDGRRSIDQILNGCCSLRSVYALTRLSDLGVIEIATPDTGPGSVSQVAQVLQASYELTEVAHAANGLTDKDTQTDDGPGPPMNVVAPAGRGEPARRRVLRYVLSTIIVGALLAFGAQSIIQAVRVDGNSMLPGLQTGQFVLISRAAYFHVDGSPLAGLVPVSSHGATRYLFGGPQRGDLVGFRSPAQGNSEFILRVIALPGERARIEQGTVFIDDRPLAEPYTLPAADPDTYPADGQSIHIADDSYFVLSDNRAVKQDSRQGWFIRVEDMVGRAWLTYWPPALWGDFAQPPQPQTPSAPASASTSSAADAGPTLAAVVDPTIAPVAPRPTPIQPTATPALPLAGTLLDGAIGNQPGWRSDPAGPVWLSGGQYRLMVQLPTRFVAVAAPVVGTYADVLVSATFHKTGGPPGGGYGIIVRDQSPEIRDGLDQSGRFYVAEAGDLGEIGMWRRDDDHWVDLVPWTHSEIVHVGRTSNELTLRAEGERLTFLVNGIQQASVLDAVLPGGGVGAFIGGDFNQVVLDRFTVQLPPTPTPP